MSATTLLPSLPNTTTRHPDLFEHNRIYAEPPITAFQPRAAYNRDNVTLELLDNLVSSHQVYISLLLHLPPPLLAPVCVTRWVMPCLCMIC